MIAALKRVERLLPPAPGTRRSISWAPWLLLLALAGCTPEGQTSPERSEQEISLEGPADAALEKRLQQIFSQMQGLEEIQVDSRGGVVHLTGPIQDLDAAERATRVAQRMEGVVYVDSDLAHESNLGSRVQSAWSATRKTLSTALSFLPLLAVALGAFGAFLWLSRALGRWKWPLQRLEVSDLSGSLVSLLVRFVIVLVGVLVALEILGLAGMVTAVVGTLGLLGVAVGLIFKDWAANFVPGIMLGLKPPFDSGDRVQIGEDEGRVVRLTARDTVLLTNDGVQLRIPNALVIERELRNLSKHPRRRLRIGLALDHGTDLKKARDLGVEALRKLRGALEKPAPFMRTLDVLVDRIDVEFYVWIDQEKVNFRNAASRGRRDVAFALRSAGIRFPTLMIGLSEARAEAVPAEPAVVDEFEGDGVDDAFLAERVREEQLSSAERDLLREGQPGQSDQERRSDRAESVADARRNDQR